LPKIELCSVDLRYFSRQGEVQAIQDVSLAVEAGEFVAVVGPSGCGKSTLLSLISGIISPTSGSIQLDGSPVRGPSRKIGYMLQQDYLFEWRSIIGNVLLAAEIQKRDLGLARKRAQDLLTRYGLGKFIDSLPRELSGGMRQRAALARTLVTEPDVILLDEPFAALDSQTRIALADEVVAELRRENKTVVLVTHDIGEAITMAERVIVMSRRPGRIKSEHRLAYASARGAPQPPLALRSAPEFNTYFQRVWAELDIHVVE
jgi:NitT/TauT family transport system ATP-binding protein